MYSLRAGLVSSSSAMALAVSGAMMRTRRNRLVPALSVLALCLTSAQGWAADDAEAPVEMVTVLGKAIYISPSNAPLEVIQPTSVVNEGFIKNNIVPTSSYDDVVKFEPSVYDQSPNGPGLGKSETLSLRGFQDGQFNVTFDGIPFGDTTDLHHTSSALFIAHDLATAEVDRGPGGGATIGKATFGGTMGFVTKGVQDNFSVNPYGSYGSFDTISGGIQFNTGDTGYGKAFIDYQHENTDGYLTFAREHRNNILGKYVMNIGDNTVLTLLGTYNKEFQYTTQGATLDQIARHGRNYGLKDNPLTQGYYAYNGATYISDFAYADVTSDIGGGWVINDKVYTDSFQHISPEGSDASSDDPADNSVTIYPDVYNPAGYPKSAAIKTDHIPGKYEDARFRGYGNIFRATFTSDFGELQFGVWYDNQLDHRTDITTDLTTGPSPGTPVPGKYGTPYKYFYRTSARTIQPFVEFDWKVTPELTLTPGVKYTTFTRDVNGPFNKGTIAPIDYTDHYDSVQPSISARYAIDDRWNVYAQIARGFLAPPIDVLQVTAPQSIDPEETWNYQIGSTMHRDQYTLSVDAYYINFSNYFAKIQVPDSTDTTFVNGGGAIYKGIEIEGQYAIGGGFSFYGNGSINSAVYKGTSVTIAESPAYTAAAGVLFDNGGGPYASAIAKVIGPRYGDDGNGIDSDTGKLIAENAYRFGSALSVDLAGGYRFGEVTDWMNNLTVSVKIGNVLNNNQLVDYAGTQDATDLPLFWTMAGRSIFFNISTDLH